MAKKIAVIYGTRPEAIKIATLARALKQSTSIDLTLVSTGQHREMLNQVNTVFGLEPDVELDLFEQGQSLNRLTSKVVKSVSSILEDLSPDATLLQGDTTTVAAAALSSFNHGTPVIHLEAGLRSGNLLSPYPEEGNRRLVSQIASLHLAPTSAAKSNLLNSGVPADMVRVTGNTVIDALFYARDKLKGNRSEIVERAKSQSNSIVLVTVHRRENWPMLGGIADAVAELAGLLPGYSFILPMHGNPEVRNVLERRLECTENVFLTDALAYSEFVSVMSACTFILTDSGGVQEEAPSLGVPVFVLRENTERPEAVEAGTVKLVGSSSADIVNKVMEVVSDSEGFNHMVKAHNPYGDGLATGRCVSAIEEMFGLGVSMPDFDGGDV